MTTYKGNRFKDNNLTDMTENRVIKVIISWRPRAFGAASDDIPGCVAAAERLDEVIREYEDGVKFYLEGLAPDEIPECLKGQYHFEYEYTIQALLHRYDGILTRAALSRITGIDPKILGHYMTGYRTPRTARRKQIIDGLHRLGNELLATH